MISLDRAKAIILCYGGYPQAWPERERQAVLQLLPDSKSLSDLQKEALALDKYMQFSDQLGEEATDWQLDQLCSEKIIASLPQQRQKLSPLSMHFINDGYRQILTIPVSIALVASAVLVVIGLSGTIRPNSIKNEIDQLSLSEYMALYVDDFTFSEREVIDDQMLDMLVFLEPQVLDDDY